MNRETILGAQGAPILHSRSVMPTMGAQGAQCPYSPHVTVVSRAVMRCAPNLCLLASRGQNRGHKGAQKCQEPAPMINRYSRRSRHTKMIMGASRAQIPNSLRTRTRLRGGCGIEPPRPNRSVTTTTPTRGVPR